MAIHCSVRYRCGKSLHPILRVTCWVQISRALVFSTREQIERELLIQIDFKLTDFYKVFMSCTQYKICERINYDKSISLLELNRASNLFTT